MINNKQLYQGRMKVPVFPDFVDNFPDFLTYFPISQL